MFSRLETAGTAALWRSSCGVDQPPDRLRPIVSLHGVDRRNARYGKYAAYGLATLRAALLPFADTGVEALVTNSLPQLRSRSAPDHPRADRITPRMPGHSTPLRIRGIHGPTRPTSSDSHHRHQQRTACDPHHGPRRGHDTAKQAPERVTAPRETSSCISILYAS